MVALAGLIVFGGLAAGFLAAGDGGDDRGLSAVDLRKPESDPEVVAIDDDEPDGDGDGDRTWGNDGTGGGDNTCSAPANAGGGGGAARTAAAATRSPA